LLTVSNAGAGARDDRPADALRADSGRSRLIAEASIRQHISIHTPNISSLALVLRPKAGARGRRFQRINALLRVWMRLVENRRRVRGLGMRQLELLPLIAGRLRRLAPKARPRAPLWPIEINPSCPVRKAQQLVLLPLIAVNRRFPAQREPPQARL
jgi:hypothetical protein